ncbi:unnamed protein product [Prunus armeniaca]
MGSANLCSSSGNSCLWASLGKWGPFLPELPFIARGLVPSLDSFLPSHMSTGGSSLRDIG